MALPPVFTSRVPVTAQPRQAVQRAESGVGGGLSLLGRALGQMADQNAEVDRAIADSEYRIAERERARDRQAAQVRFGAQLITDDADLQRAIADIEAQAPAGGAGHSERVRQLVDQRVSALRAQLPDDEEVRQAFEPQLAQMNARAMMRADAFERRQRVEGQANDMVRARNSAVNAVAANPTPENAAGQLRTLTTMVDGMELTGNDREQLLTEARDMVFGDGLIDGLIAAGNIDGARAIVQSGALQSVLTPQRMERIGQRLALEERRAAAEAEAAAREAERADREVIDGVKERVRLGLSVPEAELADAERRATARGWRDEAANLNASRIAARVNSTYAGASVAQLRAAEAAYAERAARRNPADVDVIGLRQIRQLIEARTDDRAEGYREAWAQGGASRVNVARQLSALPIEDRVDIARRVDPTGRLRWAVQLPPGTRDLAVAGASLRAGNRELLPPAQEYQRGARQMAGTAMRALSGDAQASVIELAADIYASVADQNGFDSFRPEVFRLALRQATGGVRQRGTGVWLGGLADYRGRPVLLPDGVSSTWLERHIARHPFRGASETAANIRARFIPERVFDRDVPDGVAVYRMLDPQGRELMENVRGGQRPYRLLVRAARP